MQDGTVSPVEGQRWRLGYRAELDGLRALAVTAVMLSHAYVDGFRNGGRVGVGVFFTLSGFLITALLLEERERDGRISLRAFWRRRAVRLLPAFGLLLAVFLVFPLLRARPEGWQLVGVVFYAANWVQAAGHNLGGFNHLWSLAVEEQFYVVWPLAVTGMLAVVGWRRAAWLTGMVAVASGVLRWVLLDDASRVYAGTDTNAVWLLPGCVLAFLMVKSARRPHVSGPVTTAAGVVLLALCGLPMLIDPMYRRIFDAPWFRYVAVPPLAAFLTVAVIAGLVTSGSRVLSWGPIVWVGRLSYGLYLWHWPIFEAHRHLVGPTAGGLVQTAGLFAVSLGCAWFSYALVEQPIQRRWKHRSAPGQDRVQLGDAVVAEVSVDERQQGHVAVPDLGATVRGTQ